MFVRRRADTICYPLRQWQGETIYIASSGNPAPRRRDVTEETAVPTADAAGVRDAVTVNMPADSAYLSVLRTATAGLAARLDFTLDEIEDLRIGVDEACAMLLSQALPGTELTTEFELTPEGMRISVSVLTANGRLPARDTFAWTVLSALAGDVDADVGPDDRVFIVLYKRRGTLEPT